MACRIDAGEEGALSWPGGCGGAKLTAVALGLLLPVLVVLTGVVTALLPPMQS